MERFSRSPLKERTYNNLNDEYHDTIRNLERLEEKFSEMPKYTIRWHSKKYRDEYDAIQFRIETLKAKARRIDEERSRKLSVYAKYLSLAHNYLLNNSQPKLYKWI